METLGYNNLSQRRSSLNIVPKRFSDGVIEYKVRSQGFSQPFAKVLGMFIS